MDYLLFISTVTLFALAMCPTPGPNNTVAMSIGLGSGFRAAVPYCLGAGIGADLTMALTGLGLGELFTRLPALYQILKIAGAIYLLWLAWRISGLNMPVFLRKKDKTPEKLIDPSGAEKRPDAATPDSEKKTPGFFQGIILQLVNVKVWIANIIAISAFMGIDAFRWHRLALMVLIFTILGTMCMLMWAAGGVLMRRFLSSEGIRFCNYVFASFLAASVILIFM